MRIMSNNEIQPSFGINLSNKFTGFARQYINTKPNRIKYNIQFNNKVDEFSKFGFDDYTVELYKCMRKGDIEYVMAAHKKDSKDLKEGIVIIRRNTFTRTLGEFYGMTKYKLGQKMKCGEKLKVNTIVR